MGAGDSVVAAVAYLALFAGVGFAFIFVNLLVGRFLRPSDPHREKLEIYECGEPAIGSSFVQFDLRFYVVALVFIIFDVEVAFLFPWATVFGKSQILADPSLPVVVAAAEGEPMKLTGEVQSLWRELGVAGEQSLGDASPSSVVAGVHQSGRELMGLSLAAISFFFVVLLIGFAYEWRTGALDWVRALARKAPPSSVERKAPVGRASQGSVLSSS